MRVEVTGQSQPPIVLVHFCESERDTFPLGISVETRGLEFAGWDLGLGLIMGVWLTFLVSESFNAVFGVVIS